MMEPEKKEIFEEENARDPSKKPYSTPQLTIHGNVEEITHAILKGPADGVTGSSIA